MAYAKQLTKEMLIEAGFTEITKEGRLFKGNQEIFPRWNGKKGRRNNYLCIYIYEKDSEGRLIKGNEIIRKYKRKDGSIGESKTWQAKSKTVSLQRAIWAWHYGEVPAGYVIDHVNNKHSCIEDYHLTNLQLLTPKENINKERKESTREVPCKLDRPRSYYEDKLAKYEVLYEIAKKEKMAEKAHKLRTKISQCRAKLRYWDANKQIIESNIADKKAEIERLKAKKQSVKDRQILEQYKQMFKEAGNKGMWHQMCKVIKAWDTLEDFQKEHVFEVISNFFER